MFLWRKPVVWRSISAAIFIVACFYVLTFQETSLLSQAASKIERPPRRVSSFEVDATNPVHAECATMLDAAAFNHPRPQLQKFFRDVTFETPRFDYTIVVVANIGHLPLLQNWIKSMQQNMKIQKKFAVVCMDDGLYQVMVQRNVSALKISDFLRHDMTSKGVEQDFGASGYKDLVNLKVKVVYIMMRYYRLNVLFSDADLAMKDPQLFDRFDMFMDGYEWQDFLFATDIKQNPDVCTGFYVARYSSFAVQLLARVILDRDPMKHNDQHTLNSFLRDMTRSEYLHVHFLDMRYFANGYMHQNQLLRRDGIEPFMFHANWVIGMAAKIDLLKQAGFWYLSDSEESEAFRLINA